MNAAQEVAEATHQLIGDTGKQVAIAALYNSAKTAAATTTQLCTVSRNANGKLNDPGAQQQLLDASRYSMLSSSSSLIAHVDLL